MAGQKLLVVGGSGFLGLALKTLLEADATTRTQIDLQNFSKPDVDLVLARKYSHVAICAAATDIEYCFKNPEISQQINVTGTIQLLDCIRKVGAVPIFFSTDYVFTRQHRLLKEEDEKVKPIDRLAAIKGKVATINNKIRP